MKSYMANPQNAEHNWYVVDATNQVVGRLASQIARVLQGKHKPVYTPHADTGDFIVVTNVEKLVVTGNKFEDKIYYKHSGYPGGLKETKFRHLQERHPEWVLKQAVKGMMPKNKLSREMMKKLKIYCGSEHPHSAQQPKDLVLTKNKGKK